MPNSGPIPPRSAHQSPCRRSAQLSQAAFRQVIHLSQRVPAVVEEMAFLLPTESAEQVKPQEKVWSGNVVLLKDETLVKGRCRVVKMQPCPDGLVQVATLLVNGKEYTRAIHTLTGTLDHCRRIQIAGFLFSPPPPPEYVQDSQLPGEKKEVKSVKL